MFSKQHYNRGMNNVLPIHDIPAGYADYIHNLVPNGAGWEHIGDVVADITLPQTYTKCWQWFPPYTVTGADTSTSYVFIGFRGTSCYLIYKATGTGVWTESTALFTGISVANVRKAQDNVQFLFVDGRSGNRAKRIMINDDGSIYASDMGMESSYIFPALVSLTYSDETNKGTGIGQGGIYGWCISEINEFGEEGLPSPTLWVDTYQWQRRGTTDSEGTYLYDSQLQGSLVSATIRYTIKSAQTKRLIVYRTDAYASESKQPVEEKRMVRSVVLGDFYTAGDTIDIVDTHPYGQIALDLSKDTAPAGDNILLTGGTAYVTNACKQYHYPATIERIIAINLNNPNDRHYVNKAYQIDLYDEKICGNSQNRLPNFYWEAGVDFTLPATNWAWDTDHYDHTSGNATPLVATLPVESGIEYDISVTITATASEMESLSVGGVTVPITGTGVMTVKITTTNTNALTLTPKSDYEGTISDVTLYKTGASIYAADKCRILDTDFITPLKVHLYPLNADFTYGDGTVTHTRRFARITIPEVPAGKDKIIYLVCSDALPVDYTNAFVEIADLAAAQVMYSAVTCNPVQDENTIIDLSSKLLSNATPLPSNYRTINKANINYNPSGAGFYTLDTTNDIVPFDPYFQGDLTDTGNEYNITHRPYYTNTALLQSYAGAEYLNWHSDSIMLDPQGVLYVWFSVKITAHSNQVLVELEDNALDRPALKLKSTHDGTNTLTITFECDQGDAGITCSASVTVDTTDAVNVYGRYFAVATWKNTIATTGDPDDNSMDLNLAVLDEMSSGAITRIWRSAAAGVTGTTTGAYKIDFDGGMDVHVMVEETAYSIRQSHLNIRFGDFIDTSAKTLKAAYQFSKFLPYFPIGYIGVDYEWTSDDYHNIENVTYDELSIVNDTRPGRIAWGNNEQNAYTEILGVKAMPSDKQTVDSTNIVLLTADTALVMPTAGNNKIEEWLPNIGLDNANLISDIPGGFAWKHKDQIYAYTTSRGFHTISRDESNRDRFRVSSTFPAAGYMIADKLYGRLWIVDTTNVLSYIYDANTDTWFEAKQARTGGFSQPLSFLRDGSFVAYNEAKTYKKHTTITGAAYLYTNSLGRKVRRYRVLGNLNNSITVGAEVYFSNLAQAYEQMSHTLNHWTQSGERFTHVTGNTSALTSAFTPTIGLTYIVKYTIGTIPAGAITTLTFGGDITTLLKTAGTYSLEVTATTTDPLVLTPGSTFTGYIENIIIYEKDGGQHIAGVTINHNNWASLPGLKGDDVALLLSGITSLEAIEFEDNQ